MVVLDINTGQDTTPGRLLTSGQDVGYSSVDDVVGF